MSLGLFELLVGVADRGEAVGPERVVLAAVPSHLGRAAVVAVAVDLDRDALVAPQRVHLPAGDVDVGLGHGEAGRFADLEEQDLVLALGPGEAGVVFGQGAAERG